MSSVNNNTVMNTQMTTIDVVVVKVLSPKQQAAKIAREEAKEI
jgi:hypothetical protein